MTNARPTRSRLTAATAVIGACAVVWLVSDLTGPVEETPAAQLPTVRPTTTTAAPTTTAPTAPAKATVSTVVDARTVLTSAGERVVVAGLAPPGPCWADAARGYTAETLLGAEVDLIDPTPILAAAVSPATPTANQTRAVTAAIRLPDGTDFAAGALHRGHAKPTRDAAGTHHAAATASGAAFLGLWGQPCLGEDVLPVRVPPPSPDPTPTRSPETTNRHPKPHDYFRNCRAAREAGHAPLRRGTPGYRPVLDRDRNGIACER
ncbi:excalibur calcium-binding domain-containing protein [Actinokineospora guangxiensis]|uniref:Excalibur calcium-binding domain-containing protein n=1 Tax=Actinokineospora guangxiensis TaxID=1490288 RepID=A0ABW0EHC0_9PSEU